MKKRRANEEGEAVVVATTTTVTTLVGNTHGGKALRKSNVPFQRVKVEAVKLCDELKDNSFESRVCPFSRVPRRDRSEYVVIVQGAREDDYGARANRDLIVTRGDGFRKEKNKKKRGSYRGGDITVGLILNLGIPGQNSLTPRNCSYNPTASSLKIDSAIIHCKTLSTFNV